MVVRCVWRRYARVNREMCYCCTCLARTGVLLRSRELYVGVRRRMKILMRQNCSSTFSIRPSLGAKLRAASGKASLLQGTIAFTAASTPTSTHPCPRNHVVLAFADPICLVTTDSSCEMLHLVTEASRDLLGPD
jgi:hypothetical protein